MSRRPWTDGEEARLLQLRQDGLHTETIAKLLERSDQAVRLKLHALGFSSTNPRRPTAKSEPASISQPAGSVAPVTEENQAATSGDEGGDDGEPLRADNWSPSDSSIDGDMAMARDSLALAEIRSTRQKCEQLLRVRSAEDRLVDLFRERLELFRPTLPSLVPRADEQRNDAEAEAAVLVLSDLHIGQNVSAEQTGGFGDYHVRRYCERLAYLETIVVRELRSRASRTDELVLLLIGDIVHGALQHGAEREETLLVIDQFQIATWSLHQFIARLAASVPRVRVYTAVGNHGRYPGQRKMPTVGRHSNFDHFVYAGLELSLREQCPGHIEFMLNAAPRQLLDIKGFRFLASHGDQLRGSSALSIPVAAMAREVQIATQRHAASSEKPAAYYVVGDKHRAANIGLPGGSYIMNGSFVGADEFSVFSFPPSEPAQALFWVHPRLGKTWHCDVKLGFAPALATLPYEFPERINEMLQQYRHRDPLGRCA